MLDELKARIPGGVLDLLRVPGLGPKKAAALHKELGVTNLAELKAACEAGTVAGLKGFGAKTQATILKGMDFAQSEQNRRLYWAEADVIAEKLPRISRSCPASNISNSPAVTAGARRRSAISIC
ncbi:MAG: helix-hairpin-helix domain-containing protein [Pirellulales bacterium]